MKDKMPNIIVYSPGASLQIICLDNCPTKKSTLGQSPIRRLCFPLNIFNLVNMKTATERYESFLEESVAAGTIEKLDDHTENRKHPRLRIPVGLLKAEEIHLQELTDISLGGFAFESTRPFMMRESVTVNLQGKMLVSAQVVGCEMIVNGVNSEESRFRTRCKFKDEEEAMVLLSLALEIDQSKTKKRSSGEGWA